MKIKILGLFVCLSIILNICNLTFKNAIALNGCGGETGEEALYLDRERICEDGSVVSFCDCGDNYCLVEYQGVCPED